MPEPTESPATDATSPSLLLRIRNDESEGWNRFDELYRPLIHGWCVRFGLDDSAADDACQETILRVRNSITGFQKNTSGHLFRKWLYTVTRNIVNDHFRSLGRNPAVAVGGSTACQVMHQLPVEEPVEWTSESELSDVSVIRRAVASIQNDFEERTWAAFSMSVIQGIAPAEVCRQLGMKPNARRVACFRVKHRLRAELQELVDEVLDA